MKEVARSGQVLAMLYGSAESGKTTLAKHFNMELNWKTIFTALTGSTAALLETVTANTLLH